jgi:hypothetical protein
MDTSTRETNLRSLAYSYNLDYEDVAALADIIGVEEDYTYIMYILSNVRSLDDVLEARQNI